MKKISNFVELKIIRLLNKSPDYEFRKVTATVYFDRVRDNYVIQFTDKLNVTTGLRNQRKSHEFKPFSSIDSASKDIKKMGFKEFTVSFDELRYTYKSVTYP